MQDFEKRLKKYALYLLGRRAYSTHEMREKIKQKIKKIEKYKNRERLAELDTEHQSVIFGQGSENLPKDEILSSGSARRLRPEGDRMTVLTDNIIKYLTDLQLLDDEEFAKSFAESLIRQNKSRGKIENKLKQKGISKETIDQVLEKDEERELEILKKLIETKTRHHPELLSTPKGKQKLIRLLLYRGFEYSKIKKTLKI